MPNFDIKKFLLNVSGILAQRWRVLFRMMHADRNKASSIIKAVCALHNFLRTARDPNYVPPGYIDTPDNNGVVNEGFWRTGENNLSSQQHANRSTNLEGITVREWFCNHFTGSGSVPWQLDMINRR